MNPESKSKARGKIRQKPDHAPTTERGKTKVGTKQEKYIGRGGVYYKRCKLIGGIEGNDSKNARGEKAVEGHKKEKIDSTHWKERDKEQREGDLNYWRSLIPLHAKRESGVERGERKYGQEHDYPSNDRLIRIGEFLFIGEWVTGRRGEIRKKNRKALRGEENQGAVGKEKRKERWEGVGGTPFGGKGELRPWCIGGGMHTWRALLGRKGERRKNKRWDVQGLRK